MSEFVTFGIAKKLKEKGFREKCEWHYYDDTKDIYKSSSPQCYNYGGNTSDAPTISQVLKWLREEKSIICLPHIEPIEEKWFFYVVKLPQASDFPEYLSSVIYNTYEEAALAGIEFVLDNMI